MPDLNTLKVEGTRLIPINRFNLEPAKPSASFPKDRKQKIDRSFLVYNHPILQSVDLEQQTPDQTEYFPFIDKNIIITHDTLFKNHFQENITLCFPDIEILPLDKQVFYYENLLDSDGNSSGLIGKVSLKYNIKNKPTTSLLKNIVLSLQEAILNLKVSNETININGVIDENSKTLIFDVKNQAVKIAFLNLVSNFEETKASIDLFFNFKGYSEFRKSFNLARTNFAILNNPSKAVTSKRSIANLGSSAFANSSEEILNQNQKYKESPRTRFRELRRNEIITADTSAINLKNLSGLKPQRKVVNLNNKDSFAFATNVKGKITGGDLYLSDGKFWANNTNQKAIVDLGAIGNIDLASVTIPAKGYSSHNIAVIKDHTYIAAAHDGEKAGYIAFRVTATNADQSLISLEYLAGLDPLKNVVNPSKGVVSLNNKDSFAFATNVKGKVTGGDLYLSDGKFWTNNVNQKAVIDLGNIGNIDLATVHIPTTGYLHHDIAVVKNHTYVAAAHDGEKAGYIVFRVTESNADQSLISLEYLTGLDPEKFYSKNSLFLKFKKTLSFPLSTDKASSLYKTIDGGFSDNPFNLNEDFSLYEQIFVPGVGFEKLSIYKSKMAPNEFLLIAKRYCITRSSDRQKTPCVEVIFHFEEEGTALTEDISKISFQFAIGPDLSEYDLAKLKIDLLNNNFLDGDTSDFSNDIRFIYPNEVDTKFEISGNYLLQNAEVTVDGKYFLITIATEKLNEASILINAINNSISQYANINFRYKEIKDSSIVELNIQKTIGEILTVVTDNTAKTIAIENLSLSKCKLRSALTIDESNSCMFSSDFFNQYPPLESEQNDTIKLSSLNQNLFNKNLKNIFFDYESIEDLQKEISQSISNSTTYNRFIQIRIDSQKDTVARIQMELKVEATGSTQNFEKMQSEFSTPILFNFLTFNSVTTISIIKYKVMCFDKNNNILGENSFSFDYSKSAILSIPKITF